MNMIISALFEIGLVLLVGVVVGVVTGGTAAVFKICSSIKSSKRILGISSCRHKWAYPLQACQNGCGTRREEPRNLEGVIYRQHFKQIYDSPSKYIETRQNPSLCTLHQVLCNRSDTHPSGNSGTWAGGWVCCHYHWPHMEANKKFAIDYFSTTVKDCNRLSLSENAAERVNRWLNEERKPVERKPVVRQLPIYRYPGFFGEGGKFYCYDKAVVNKETLLVPVKETL